MMLLVVYTYFALDAFLAPLNINYAFSRESSLRISKLAGALS